MKLQTGHIYIKDGALVESPPRYAGTEWWDSLIDLDYGVFTGEITVRDFANNRVNVSVTGHPQYEKFEAVLMFKDFYKMVTSKNYKDGVYTGRISPTAKGTTKGIRTID